MTQPRLSIVIVNYNYAAFVGEALESALGQDQIGGIAGVEVIVVDDASTDGSRAVIDGYADRVTAIHRSVNGGMSAAVSVR